MFKKTLFWEMFILVIIVGILDAIANMRDLYWSASEYDSVVHFFGGAMVAMFFLWLYFYSDYFNPPQKNLRSFLLVALLGSLTVAVLWEMYEVLIGESIIQKSQYFFDTSLDFIMDILGILAACFYGYLRELKIEKQIV